MSKGWEFEPDGDECGWKEIATAPKDGTYVLLCIAGFVPAVGAWEHGEWDTGDADCECCFKGLY